MEKSCGDSSHVLTRYVVYKGEKYISKPFSEKDRCQFCKEQLGASVFYCKSCSHAWTFQCFCAMNLQSTDTRSIIQAVRLVTKAATTFAGNAT